MEAMGDEMNVEVWSRLPSEVLEGVLAFLSVPELSRFRTVCKRWNSLISEPAFGALCAQRARRNFFVTRYAIPDKQSLNYETSQFWSFLDVSARRWYTIKAHERQVSDAFVEGEALAMDGGLVCRLLSADRHEEEDDEKEDVSVLMVSNPIAKTSRRLQPAPHCTEGRVFSGKMVMLVDNFARKYTIFVMPSGDGHRASYAAPPPMLLYDSILNRWRTSTPPLSSCSRIRSGVVFNGLLYTLMSARGSALRNGTDYKLWSYNLAEDAWTDTRLSVHSIDANPELIVSDNKLFFASWMRVTDGYCPSSWTYEVSELCLADRTRRMVFHVPGDEAAKRFDVSFPNLFKALHVTGFCESIIVMCKSSGVSSMFELRSRSWVTLPDHPMVVGTDLQCWPDSRCLLDRGCWLDFGRPMNLSLPASTVWADDLEANM